MIGAGEMKKPNFFIVGAPKCGTTSLATWLGGHQNIFITPGKEPHYFSQTAVPLEWRDTWRTLDWYESLYQNAAAEHIAVGEATPTYLQFAGYAIPAILEYCTDPLFIVCLRNPVEMAPSLHSEMVYLGLENILDFSQAWQLRKLRHQHLPQHSPFGRYTPRQYDHECALGSQLESLYKLVPRSRVLTVMLEDVMTDPRKEYLRILEFLGVPDDSKTDFLAQNQSKVRKSMPLVHLTRALGDLKFRLGIRTNFGLLEFLDVSNRRQHPRAQLGAALKRELKSYFVPEVEKMSRLLDRDLSHWISDIDALPLSQQVMV